MNRIVGTKVSIVSARPQTTRTQIRGVRTTPDNQIVLLDTPGHPQAAHAARRAHQRARPVDAARRSTSCACSSTRTAAIGRGDRFVAELVQAVPTPKILVVNKTDIAPHAEVAEHLAVATAKLGEFDAYVPAVGAHRRRRRRARRRDRGAAARRARSTTRTAWSPTSPRRSSPPSSCARSCCSSRATSCPHSIAVVVEEIEPDDGEDPRDRDGTDAADDGILRFRALIRVERDSQKGIVIGKGGAVLQEAGTRAREELEALLGTRVYLETQVRVDRDWQRRAHSLDRLGF